MACVLIRRQLPVMQLNFGGADGRGGKMARFELGPLYCSGSAADQDAAAGWREGPRNCRDLWRGGVTQVCRRKMVQKTSFYIWCSHCIFPRRWDIISSNHRPARQSIPGKYSSSHIREGTVH